MKVRAGLPQPDHDSRQNFAILFYTLRNLAPLHRLRLRKVPLFKQDITILPFHPAGGASNVTSSYLATQISVCALVSQMP
jgi:hypothetical protein